VKESFTLLYFLLLHLILLYFTLFCFILLYSTLFYFTLFYFLLYFTLLYFIVLHYKSFRGVDSGQHIRLTASPPSVSLLSRQCEILNISQPYTTARPFVGIFEVEVKLRPTVSRPVRLGVRHPSGTRDLFFFLLEILFRQLRVCYFVAPSLTRGRVCNLLLLLVLARAVPRDSRSYFIVPILGTPNLEDQVHYSYPPGTGWPSYTPRHWVPFLIILGEEYTSRSSSLCSFLQSRVTSSLLGPNILSTLFSNSLSLCSLL
jgi:hypothetical protein